MLDADVMARQRIHGMSLSLLLFVTACTVGGDAMSEPSGPVGGKGDGGKAVSMVLLQANVGNVALTCGAYKYKLCYSETEDRIAASIRTQAADVISLQEVSSVEQCQAMDERDPAKVCYPTHTAEVAEQARRLVGDGYTIACDTRNHFECVAVRSGWGSIAGCADGDLCIDPDVSETAPPPGPGCDAGFSVSEVTIEPRGGRPFRLVDLHPPSGRAVDCRRAALVQVFEGADALARGPRSLLAGDFNLDPFAGDDASEQYLRAHVGSGHPFRFHSGTAEQKPPLMSAFYPIGNHTYDHVISNFASGTCKTLGEAVGTSRLDGGSGTDHRALRCRLEI